MTRKRTRGEAIIFYTETLRRLERLIDQDDGSYLTRRRRLKKAQKIIEGGLDGLDAVSEWD